MLRQAHPGDLFPLRPRLTVIAVRVDRDAAAREETSPDLDVFRVHQLDQVFHDDVHAVLMKIAVIAEAEQIELQRFALDHALGRHIGYADIAEVRLPGDRAKRCELRAVEFDKIVVIRVLVLKGFQHFRGVIEIIAVDFAAKQRDTFYILFSCHNLSPFNLCKVPWPGLLRHWPQKLSGGQCRYRIFRMGGRRPHSSSM